MKLRARFLRALCSILFGFIFSANSLAFNSNYFYKKTDSALDENGKVALFATTLSLLSNRHISPSEIPAEKFPASSLYKQLSSFYNLEYSLASKESDNSAVYALLRALNSGFLIILENSNSFLLIYDKTEDGFFETYDPLTGSNSSIAYFDLVSSLPSSAIFHLFREPSTLRKADYFSAADFSASSSSLKSSASSRLSLKNYSLENPSLSAFENETVKTAISDYFSFAYPEFSFLTFEKTSESDFTLTSDSEKTFSGTLEVVDSSYELSLKKDSQVIFTYSGKNSFDFSDRSSEPLALNLITRLPYSSTLNDDINFTLYYSGGNRNVLTLSLAKNSPETCSEAKEKALAYLSTLKLDYKKEITKKNLLCE